MKTVIIHGQSHKGNTYTIAHELGEKIGGELKEFFLPRDFDEPCRGCWTCFNSLGKYQIQSREKEQF